MTPTSTQGATAAGRATAGGRGPPGGRYPAYGKQRVRQAREQRRAQMTPTTTQGSSAGEEITPGPKIAPQNAGVTLLRVAWLAVALGLAMEALLLLLASGFGEALGLKALVADLVRNITWAAFVCVGLAVGTTLSKIRVPAMGFFGFLAAPLAFEVSRSVHKGTLEALDLAGAGGAAASPVLLALIKGIEYGCLGLLVGWIGTRAWGGGFAHALAGPAAGAA